MADVNDLKSYYPGKLIASDGGALVELVADSGTVSTITDAALTQADDFWNGGILYFSGDTPTVALQGLTAHVKDFDAASDTLTLAKDLPAVVATGELYQLVLGGNFRSDTQQLALLSGGVFPELANIALTNITGVTLKYVSPGIIENFSSLDVDWVFATALINVGGGATFNVTGNETDLVLVDSFGEGYIIVDIVFASLPGSNQTDSLTISRRNQTFVPDIEGFEALNSLKGKTRYRLTVIKNEGIDTMNSLVVAGTIEDLSTTVAAAETSNLDANSFDVDDATGFPTGNFWLKNSTLDDFRYVVSRSGNTMTVAASNAWTKFNIDANNTVEPFPGDSITSPSGSGIIDAIKLISGTWAGGDANADFYVKDVTGNFLDTEQVQISAVNIGLQNGAETKGLRDKTGQTWVATNVVELGTNVDLAVQAPATLQFSDPSSETLYPDPSLSFIDAPDVLSDNIAIANLTASSIYGIWQREWIMDDHQSGTDLTADLEYAWS